MTDDQWTQYLKAYDEGIHDTDIFMDGIHRFFSSHPSVKVDGIPVIHSMKKRLKGKDNLRKKIDRKNSDGRGITPDNLFTTVTDLAGVRLLLLFQADFSVVDAAVRAKVGGGDWVLHESRRLSRGTRKRRDFSQLLTLMWFKETQVTPASTISSSQEPTRRFAVNFKLGHFLKRSGVRLIIALTIPIQQRVFLAGSN